MVYLSRITANARTKGALFVSSTVCSSSSSSASMLGNVRDSSMAAGVKGSVPEACLGFFFGEGESVPEDSLFFDNLLAAFWTFVVIFSSEKISLRVFMSTFAS